MTVPAGLAQHSIPVGLGIASAGVHALSGPRLADVGFKLSVHVSRCQRQRLTHDTADGAVVVVAVCKHHCYDIPSGRSFALQLATANTPLPRGWAIGRQTAFVLASRASV